MRRLLALTCAILLVETTFFAALSPLLPRFANEFDLSKWESGLLVAAYALGAVIGGIPAGLVSSRAGVRTTVVLGLLALTATSALFGLVDGYWPLVLTRLAQGIAAAFCWTGSLAWLVSAAQRDRRGEVIGIAMSAAIGGALLGPVLGGAAFHFGRAPAFAGVAALALGLAVAASRTAQPARSESQPLRILLAAIREPRVIVGMWLLILPAILFGTLSVLGPLQLDELGWGVLGVAATFFVAAAIEAALSPLVGRWSDRSGRLAPMRVGLVAGATVALVIPWIDNRWTLSVFMIGAGITWGMFWTPSMAMLSDGWEAAGVGHGLGFALMNLAWAPGAVLGAAVGGALADVAGDMAAYSVLAALCLATLVGIQGRSVRAAAAPIPAEPG